MKLKEIAQYPATRTNEPSLNWVLPDRFVGIEVEVENFREEDIDREYLPFLYEYWKRITDGSLRNDGAELVSQPVMGKDLANALRTLQDYMPRWVSWSHRCSVHVHFDIRKWEVDELLSCLYFYIVMEPLLFTYAPKRAHSQYCIPLYSSLGQGIEKVIIAMRDPHRHDELAEHLDYIYRYSAINLRAVRKFATLEFRHLEGTSSQHLLTNWINILMGIVTGAEKLSPSQMLKALKRVDTREKLITDIYGDFKELITGIAGWEKLLYRGATTLKEILGVVRAYEKNRNNPGFDRTFIENVHKDSSYARYRKTKRKQRSSKPREHRKSPVERLLSDTMVRLDDL